MPTKIQPVISAGIDVGGSTKGFHAVALKDGTYFSKYSSKNAAEIVNWCRAEMKASVIAIDAPCRWSSDGRARPSERELMAEKIWCFSSTTRMDSVGHPKNYFGWMLKGEELYGLLETTHALCKSLPITINHQYCFETFPHAISCKLAGKILSAKSKRNDRRMILKTYRIDLGTLTNIDLVDAALCALTAHFLAIGKTCKGYGKPDTGLIIVPDF